jgi:hypothetical protein
MSKRKGKIPRVSVGAVKPFNVTDEAWQKIDAAFGRSTSREARTQVALATAGFLRAAQAEKNAGLMDHALQRVNRLRECAQQLIDAVGDRDIGDVIREYVDDELGEEYSRLKVEKDFDKRLPTHRYVSWVSLELGRFANACHNWIDIAPRHGFWPDGGAWNQWIRQLTAILEAHNLPTGASKDTTKKKSDRASPFVDFVYSLQELLPNEYFRGQHSAGALATAISRARKVSRRPLKPKKTSATSPGRDKRLTSP